MLLKVGIYCFFPWSQSLAAVRQLELSTRLARQDQMSIFFTGFVKSVQVV